MPTPLWLPGPTPNSRGSQEPHTPQPWLAAAGHPPLQVGPRDKVGTPSRGGAARHSLGRRPGAGSAREGGRARGGQAAPGRAAPGWAGLGWAPGAYLGARAVAPGAVGAPPGSCCSRWRLRRSRRGCSGAPRRRFPAICGSPGGGGGGGGDSRGDSSARRGPEQSNSCGRRAEAPNRGPRAERLRARPRPGEGREPQRRGAPGAGGAPPGPPAWPRTPG